MQASTVVLPARAHVWSRCAAWALLTAGVMSAPVADTPPRDPVRRLRAMDQDGDGRVSREEFRGPDTIFRRMDSNQDGFVTPAEAVAMRNRNRAGAAPAARSGRESAAPPDRPAPPNRRPPGGGGLSPLRLDADHDGTISRAEWDEAFQGADTNGDALLDRREWEAAVRGGPPKDPAPAVGSPAPQVRARKQNSEAWVDLSAPNRFTVLVFGSHT